MNNSSKLSTNNSFQYSTHIKSKNKTKVVKEPTGYRTKEIYDRVKKIAKGIVHTSERFPWKRILTEYNSIYSYEQILNDSKLRNLLKDYKKDIQECFKNNQENLNVNLKKEPWKVQTKKLYDRVREIAKDIILPSSDKPIPWKKITQIYNETYPQEHLSNNRYLAKKLKPFEEGIKECFKKVEAPMSINSSSLTKVSLQPLKAKDKTNYHELFLIRIQDIAKDFEPDPHGGPDRIPWKKIKASYLQLYPNEQFYKLHEIYTLFKKDFPLIRCCLKKKAAVELLDEVLEIAAGLDPNLSCVPWGRITLIYNNIHKDRPINDLRFIESKLRNYRKLILERIKSQSNEIPRGKKRSFENLRGDNLISYSSNLTTPSFSLSSSSFSSSPSKVSDSSNPGLLLDDVQLSGTLNPPTSLEGDFNDSVINEMTSLFPFSIENHLQNTSPIISSSSKDVAPEDSDLFDLSKIPMIDSMPPLKPILKPKKKKQRVKKAKGFKKQLKKSIVEILDITKDLILPANGEIPWQRISEIYNLKHPQKKCSCQKLKESFLRSSLKIKQNFKNTKKLEENFVEKQRTSINPIPTKRNENESLDVSVFSNPETGSEDFLQPMTPLGSSCLSPFPKDDCNFSDINSTLSSEDFW